MDTSYDRLTADKEDMRLYQQERAIEAVSSLICRTMDREGISRTGLAELLGVTPGWVTQLLDGERNKTIRSVSDVFTALGHKIEFSAEPIAAAADRISCVSIRGRGRAMTRSDTSEARETTYPATIPYCVA